MRVDMFYHCLLVHEGRMEGRKGDNIPDWLSHSDKSVLLLTLDEVKGISLLLYLLMVRMKLKLIEERQESLSLIDNFNCI
jgi:hypothetical protein